VFKKETACLYTVGRDERHGKFSNDCPEDKLLATDPHTPGINQEVAAIHV
jgi:hypothetical protein